MTDKEKIKFWAKGRLYEIMNGIGENDAKIILKDLLSFIDSMQEEPKSNFEQSIQEGDNIVYNEDLGCRVNLSQLERVAKKEEPVSEDMWEASKQYALRQVLASTDTKMSEQAYLSLKLFSGFEIAVAHKDGANWQLNQIRKKNE